MGSATSQDCVFCRIVRGESPAEVLFETPRVMAILDIHPIHHGHALILPRCHCRDLLEVPPDHLHDLLAASQTVARALVETLGLEGFNVFCNNGRAAGQSVFHFHMHVTPRYPDDNIRFVLNLKEYPPMAMRETADRLRTGIRHAAAAPGSGPHPDHSTETSCPHTPN